MDDTQIKELLQEIRDEQHISKSEKDETLKTYVKEAEFDINDTCGRQINYKEDLKARSLLKNYVVYARFKRLAEFKQLYGGEYVKLQAKYYKLADVQ